ncbi:MAG: hypothetical protein WA705_23620 [Candidatus Ozemobacteraceae bacterium]
MILQHAAIMLAAIMPVIGRFLVQKAPQHNTPHFLQKSPCVVV